MLTALWSDGVVSQTFKFSVFKKHTTKTQLQYGIQFSKFQLDCNSDDQDSKFNQPEKQ
jgi:hypothetical protein